jgi:hypothetical protein
MAEGHDPAARGFRFVSPGHFLDEIGDTLAGARVEIQGRLP